MVWDVRSRIPTVKSMSALPMAGLAYAVGSKAARAHETGSSRLSSPPPEYDRQTTPSAEGTRIEIAEVAPPVIDPADLERALVLQKWKSEARDRSRYITQGSLMLRSSQETQFAAQSLEELQFSRELYLSSLEFLMRGIPTDLTDMERETLSRSVKSLHARLDLRTVEAHGDDAVGSARTQQLFVGICRGTAIMIRLSVPRIKRSLEQAIEFENRYHVLERSTILLSNSITSVADRATRTTIRIPDVSRFIGLASNIYFGLSLGLQEGYRVLNDEQAY